MNIRNGLVWALCISPSMAYAENGSQWINPACISVETEGLGTNTNTAHLKNNCGAKVGVWAGLMLNDVPIEWAWAVASMRQSAPRLTMAPNETYSSGPYPFRCCGSYGWVVKAVKILD